MTHVFVIPASAPDQKADDAEGNQDDAAGRRSNDQAQAETLSIWAIFIDFHVKVFLWQLFWLRYLEYWLWFCDTLWVMCQETQRSYDVVGVRAVEANYLLFRRELI